MCGFELGEEMELSLLNMSPWGGNPHLYIVLYLKKWSRFIWETSSKIMIQIMWKTE